MPYSPPEKGHQSLRKGRVSLPNTSYYLTICTRDRKPGLTCKDIFDATLERSRAMAEGNVWHARVLTLMPDHLHTVVRLGEGHNLSDAFKTFKGPLSVALRKHNLRWQPGTNYEHRIRPGEPLTPVFHYIFMNPYRKKLAGSDEVWPYFYCCPEDWEWFETHTKDSLPYPEWLET